MGIAGVGLLGGSLALQLRNLGVTVTGYDPDSTALSYALAHSIIDRGAASLSELLGGVDALVLCAPVDAVIAMLAALRHDPVAARIEWIIDVASVKTPVMAAAVGMRNFVGTHPMAGSEAQGPRAARRDLFAGRPWAIVDDADPGPRARVEILIRALGAYPVTLAAADHDRIVAATSHAPQLLSSVICAELEVSRLAGLFGPGLLSMIRLGRSPWSMWRGVLSANRQPVAAALRRIGKRLAAVADALEANDSPQLEALFADAHRNASLLDDQGAARA